jgi:hypothetical protein
MSFLILLPLCTYVAIVNDMEETPMKILSHDQALTVMYSAQGDFSFRSISGGTVTFLVPRKRPECAWMYTEPRCIHPRNYDKATA